jgi:hypothetical protein
MVYEDFSFFQRHIPGTHFHKELLSFEDLAKRFLKDAWVSLHPCFKPSSQFSTENDGARGSDDQLGNDL